MKTKLAPLRQEKDYTCLPAAIRMVMRHFGVELSEELIASASGTNQRGSNLEEAAEGMKALGFDAVVLEEAELPELVDYLDRDIPIIAAVDVDYLPYGALASMRSWLMDWKEMESRLLIPRWGKSFLWTS